MILSLLIPTIPPRAALLARLMAILTPQIVKGVEVLHLLDAGDTPIGTKRQRLLEAAQGEYICFIDDDDTVSETYVAAILKALESKPDCVGFKLHYSVNGRLQGETRHYLEAGKYWEEQGPTGLRIYHRTPNHINPIRRDLALATGFKPLNWSEDNDYAVRIYPLLKTTVFIDEFLYHYLYIPVQQRKDEGNYRVKRA